MARPAALGRRVGRIHVDGCPCVPPAEHEPIGIRAAAAPRASIRCDRPLAGTIVRRHRASGEPPRHAGASAAPTARNRRQPRERRAHRRPGDRAWSGAELVRQRLRAFCGPALGEPSRRPPAVSVSPLSCGQALRLFWRLPCYARAGDHEERRSRRHDVSASAPPRVPRDVIDWLLLGGTLLGVALGLIAALGEILGWWRE
jgi:hypothetical protein